MEYLPIFICFPCYNFDIFYWRTLLQYKDRKGQNFMVFLTVHNIICFVYNKFAKFSVYKTIVSVFVEVSDRYIFKNYILIMIA